MPRIDLSPEMHNALHALATPVVKRKGTILFQAGTPSQGAFLIRTGRVKLMLEPSSGLYPDRILGPGEVIGVPASVSGEPYSLTAQAMKNCKLDFIPRAKLLDLLRANPEIAFQILQVLSEESFQARNAAMRMVPLRPIRRMRGNENHLSPSPQDAHKGKDTRKTTQSEKNP